jgi:hypothetical protein
LAVKREINVSKKPETIRQATYTDVSGRQQERYLIEKQQEKFVVRDLFENKIVESGFETSKQAWDWMCKTPTSELV